MTRHGKKYGISFKKVDRRKSYVAAEAFGLLKDTAYANFDESVEVHFNLGIDPKQADQAIRGTLMLPHGTGKSTRVVVIAQGDKISAAKSAGADEAGAEDLIERINGGWLDFDIVIASPDMMGKVGKLGRVLGARGLMPSPKSGTVTPDIANAVKEFKAGKLEYRNDKAGIVHLVIGKKSFSADQLVDNYTRVLEVIQKAKPAKAKGIYIKSVICAATMGPGIKIKAEV